MFVSPQRRRCIRARRSRRSLCPMPLYHFVIPLAQRYAADLYPFLIFCLVIFLRSGGVALMRSRHVMIGLIALSVVVNSLATVSWLMDADQNVPAETKSGLGKTSWGDIRIESGSGK